jgi:tetratricopeptide (TPR) repeat protein
MSQRRQQASSHGSSSSLASRSSGVVTNRRAGALLAGAVLTAALALTAGSWLPWLPVVFGFLEANSETIGVLADLAQIIEVVGIGVALVLGVLGFRGLRGAGEEVVVSPGPVAEGERSVAGRDFTGPIFTGDHNVLRLETGEELYERLRSEFAPPRLGTAPPVPDMFVGREEDLAELKGRLRRAAEGKVLVPVQILTAVHGWPGVGKTTVAAALAHDEEIRRMFPDGVLFYSLGRDPDVLSEIVAWGRALGVGDLSDSADVREASGRLAAALRERQVLMILDDVWDAAHARLLAVGGRRCATLVTTRLNRVAHELSPEAEGVHRLPVLSDEEALELLARLAPEVVADHHDEARDLVRELDGLPLAVRVAGGLLAAEQSAGFGVAELLEELRQGKRLLEEEAPPSYTATDGEVPLTVAALLRRSTDRLDSLRRKRFALLSVLPPRPVSFDSPAAQDLWATENDPRPTLREFLGRGLIEPAGDGRCQIHSLLSAFARSLLEEDARFPGIREAERRYLRHYEVKIGALNYVFEQGGEQMEQALEAFDADLESIRAAHSLAVSRMEEDDAAARFVSDYVSAGPNMLMYRLAPEERIRWWEAALSAARRLRDADSESAHSANLGTAYLMADRPRQALPHLEKALADARRPPRNLHAVAAALGNLAGTYADFGDHRKAVKISRECLVVAREAGDRRIEAQVHGTLGSNLAELGELREAVRYLKRQKDLARDPALRDLPSEARALRKLGILYRDIGYPWRAAVLFEGSATIFERLGDDRTRHGVLLSYGILCVQRENYDRALTVFDQVIESAENTDDGGAKAVALMNKGNVEDLLGRSNLADDFYRAAIATARDVGALETEGDASWNRAQLLEAQGDHDAAHACAQDALAAYQALGNPKSETVQAYLNGRSLP